MEVQFQDIVQYANMKMRVSKASSMIKEYGENTIVLFRIGDTYETYESNAEAVHKICEFPIIHFGKIAFLDFKVDCNFWVFPKLVRAGFKICIREN